MKLSTLFYLTVAMGLALFSLAIAQTETPEPVTPQIGRASCRERV